MKRVVWSDTATAEYLEILGYIADDDANAAARVSLSIRQAGNSLAEFATGHPGRVHGTYEKSVMRLPYIIVYALSAQDTVVTILRVIHTSRDWPAETWPQ